MKNDRHNEILKLIRKYNIETQAELAARLNEAGFNVTQATVSRDIRTLKLSKAPADNGRTCYVAPESTHKLPKYIRVFRDSIETMQLASNLLVIKTIPGMAMAAAAALDEWGNENLVGCVAGDDTILCACVDPVHAQLLKEEIEG